MKSAAPLAPYVLLSVWDTYRTRLAHPTACHTEDSASNIHSTMYVIAMCGGHVIVKRLVETWERWDRGWSSWGGDVSPSRATRSGPCMYYIGASADGAAPFIIRSRRGRLVSSWLVHADKAG